MSPSDPPGLARARRRHALAPIGVALLALEASAPAGAEPLALGGAPAPGIPGAVFQALSPPRSAYDGRLLFEATVTGGGVTAENDEGVWIGGPGSLDLLLREGDPAPGVPGGVFGRLGGGDLLEAAEIRGDRLAILAAVRGPAITSSTDQGIWASEGGPLELVVRKGSQVPSAPAGVFYLALSALRMDGAGRVAFRAVLDGPGVVAENDTAALGERGGALELLAREGDPAPGLPGDAYEAVVELARDRDGPIAIEFAGGSGDQGIWIAGEAGAPSPFVLAGAAAPGGGTFQSFSRICLDGGHVHLRGSFFEGGTKSGIWSGTLAGLAPLVRAGEPAPGGGPDGSFVSLTLEDCREAHAVLRGTIVGSTVTPDDDHGVWAWRDGSLELVARTGDPVPNPRGLPDATFFTFFEASIGPTGLVAVEARLDYDALAMAPIEPAIVRETAGGLRLVARDGRLLAVQPGDNRRVTPFLQLVRGFDDEGGIAFWAGFEDGSRAVLRAPEPGALALSGAALGALAALARAKRRS
jgi:hypothetical protein